MIECQRTGCSHNKAKFIDSKDNNICNLDCIRIVTSHAETSIDGTVVCENFTRGNKVFQKPYEEGYAY